MNLVFDLYGTLVDIRTDESAPGFRKKVQKYFSRLNPELTDFWGEYERLCLEQNCGEEDEIDLSAVFERLAGKHNAAKAAAFFRKASRKKLRLYKGVDKLLGELRRNGAKLYLLTNAQTCFTLGELEKLGLIDRFDGIRISSEMGKKKPSRAFFDSVLEGYGLDPDQTVYVGNDFHADILGAKAAGLRAAYIRSNISPEDDDLSEAREVADFATDDFSALGKYLLSLCGD